MKYTIQIDQYDLDLKIFTTKLSLTRYLNKHDYKISHSLNEVDGLALYFENSGADLILYVDEKSDPLTMDHELIHITWYIAKIIGHPLSFNTQEFQTYLFTDLKKKIKKKIWKKQ